MKFLDIISNSPPIVKRKLTQLKFLKERPDFHPEPSVFHHIQIVTERLILTEDLDLIFSGILHDICKLDTVEINEKTGWPTSPGHDKASYLLINDFSNGIFKWIQENGGDAFKVSRICKEHMRFKQIKNMRESKRIHMIKELNTFGIFHKLQIFEKADDMISEFNLDKIKFIL